MRRSIRTASGSGARAIGRAAVIGRLLFAPVVVALLSVLTGCGGKGSEPAMPSLLRTVALSDGADSLRPVRLQVFGDSLFVSYRGLQRIDVYDLDLERKGTIELVRPEPVTPTTFAVTDSQIVVSDHALGAVVIYDRRGNLITSFGMLPDGTTRLSPMKLAWHKGVAYVADMTLNRILAISTTSSPGVVDLGELILKIPYESETPIGLPSAVFVTPDGRLLVGDAETGLIRVFTCDGRAIYSFDPLPDGAAMSPQGFAMDGLRDLNLGEAHSFDPSGVREQGHIHVADGQAGMIRVFNSLGKYVGSYPDDQDLDTPSDIACATQRSRIYVADAEAGAIHIFGYGEEAR